MRRRLVHTTLVALAAAVACIGAVHAQSPAPPPAPTAVMSAAECEVWARELGFARAVAGHDAAAFAAHVDEHAAFGTGSPVPTRGRDAIVRDWARIIEGDGMRLSWYPTRVTISDGADVAWSSGPALFESLAPGAPHRYAISAFDSVWRRGADGVWRVLYDDGVPPKPASEAEVAAFHAGRREACPQG